MGTLTWIIPLESTVTESSPAQLFVHGPAAEDAHSTVATLPGARLLHASTPLALKEVITVCPRAATVAPSANALQRPRLMVRDLNLMILFCASSGYKASVFSSNSLYGQKSGETVETVGPQPEAWFTQLKLGVNERKTRAAGFGFGKRACLRRIGRGSAPLDQFCH